MDCLAVGQRRCGVGAVGNVGWGEAGRGASAEGVGIFELCLR